jgi:hypothetical protein
MWFFTCKKYVVKVANLFQCVLLLELNAQEDEWFVATYKLYKKEKGKTKGEKINK